MQVFENWHYILTCLKKTDQCVHQWCGAEPFPMQNFWLLKIILFHKIPGLLCAGFKLLPSETELSGVSDCAGSDSGAGGEPITLVRQLNHNIRYAIKCVCQNWSVDGFQCLFPSNLKKWCEGNTSWLTSCCATEAKWKALVLFPYLKTQRNITELRSGNPNAKRTVPTRKHNEPISSLSFWTYSISVIPKSLGWAI